jgi:ABC-type sulfate transport system substrate-binding protein
LERKHLDNIVSKRLKNISSVAFGGKDLRTVFLGCLLGDQIATFKTEQTGIPPSHWNPIRLINKDFS